MNDSQWLSWSRKLQAIAQNGLTYANDPYDVDRYEQITSISAEIMEAHTNLRAADVRAIFEKETGYATPKVDVRGFVQKDNGVLLVKERADGLWTLPGGWADVNDAPSEAVVREIVEESGYRVRATKLLALYDRNKHGHPPFPFHVYKLFFQCELLGGRPTTSMETVDVGFFPLEELPPLSATRVTRSQITGLFDLAARSDSATAFD